MDNDVLSQRRLQHEVDNLLCISAVKIQFAPSQPEAFIVDLFLLHRPFYMGTDSVDYSRCLSIGKKDDVYETVRLSSFVIIIFLLPYDHGRNY